MLIENVKLSRLNAHLWHNAALQIQLEECQIALFQYRLEVLDFLLELINGRLQRVELLLRLVHDEESLLDIWKPMGRLEYDFALAQPQKLGVRCSRWLWLLLRSIVISRRLLLLLFDGVELVRGLVVELLQIGIFVEVADAMAELTLVKIRPHERHLDIVLFARVQLELTWLYSQAKKKLYLLKL